MYKIFRLKFSPNIKKIVVFLASKEFNANFVISEFTKLYFYGVFRTNRTLQSKI